MTKKQGHNGEQEQPKPKKHIKSVDIARLSTYQPQSIQFQQCGGGRRIIRKKPGGD